MELFVLLLVGAVFGVFECLGLLAAFGCVNQWLLLGLIPLTLHAALTARLAWDWYHPQGASYIVFGVWVLVTAGALIAGLVTLFVSGFSIGFSFG